MHATLWLWARMRDALFEWRKRRLIAQAAKRYVRELKRASKPKET